MDGVDDGFEVMADGDSVGGLDGDDVGLFVTCVGVRVVSVVVEEVGDTDGSLDGGYNVGDELG